MQSMGHISKLSFSSASHFLSGQNCFSRNGTHVDRSLFVALVGPTQVQFEEALKSPKLKLLAPIGLVQFVRKIQSYPIFDVPCPGTQPPLQARGVFACAQMSTKYFSLPWVRGLQVGVFSTVRLNATLCWASSFTRQRISTLWPFQTCISLNRPHFSLSVNFCLLFDWTFKKSHSNIRFGANWSKKQRWELREVLRGRTLCPTNKTTSVKKQVLPG